MIKVVSGPLVDPVTLQEARQFMRLATNGFASDFHEFSQVAAGRYVMQAVNGPSVDVLTMGKVAVVTSLGAIEADGVLIVQLQESNDQAAWSNWGTAVSYTAADANSVKQFVYTGSAQYLKVVATFTGGASYAAISLAKDAATSPDDLVIRQLIKAATNLVEREVGRYLIERTVDWTEDSFPKGRFLGVLTGWSEHPRFMQPEVGTLKTVTGVYYTPAGGVETGFDGCQVVDGRLVLKYGRSWPTNLEEFGGARIRCTLGYGSAADVPADLKQAVLVLVKCLYEDRSLKEPPQAVFDLIAPYAVRRF